MGPVSAIDLATALAAGDGTAAIALTQGWVAGAWDAWADHHRAIRARADALTRLFG
jgi:hypothetical protein